MPDILSLDCPLRVPPPALTADRAPNIHPRDSTPIPMWATGDPVAFLWMASCGRAQTCDPAANQRELPAGPGAPLDRSCIT